ncbi:hypothetical protein N9L01_00625 [bacterium]|nr:hypothetical protein [bacterium]
MGSRAWGAERRFPSDISQMRVYDRSGDSEALLPQAIADKAKDLGWDEIWQLTYCQWCASYAHESEPWMVDSYWEDPELGDARQVWGPSARSVFSLIDKDEAAWVIDEDYKYPVIGLVEMRLNGWWSYGYGRSDDFQTIDIPQPWAFSSDDNKIGTNENMSAQEKDRVDSFWRSRPEVETMLKLNSCVIQIPFLTRGAFAKFRDVMYADEDNPAETDKFPQTLYAVQYDGPLYHFWKKIIIDDEYTWPDDLQLSYAITYAQQVTQLTRVLSEAYRQVFDDEMPISPSSPIQPQEFIDHPLSEETNVVLNRRGYPISGAGVNIVFDVLAPLVHGDGTLKLDANGDAVFHDRS